MRVGLALRSPPSARGGRGGLTLGPLTAHRKAAEAAHAARRRILASVAVLTAGGILARPLPGLAAAHHASKALLERHAQLASSEEALGLPRRDQRQRLRLPYVGAERLDIGAGSTAARPAAASAAKPSSAASAAPSAKALRKDVAGAQADRQARKQRAENILGHGFA